MPSRVTRFLHLSLAAFLCLAASTALRAEVIHRAKSEFNGQVIVRETAGVREMMFEDDGAVQSAYRVGHPEQLQLEYARAAMSALAIVPEPKRILIVGLGGGSMPMFLRHFYPDVQIDLAELDPAVVDAAKRFFDFREDPKMKVYVGDGRAFVKKTENRYDIIFLDAYGSDSIPYMLATREFLNAVRSRLTDGGIVASNVWGAAGNKLYWSMVRTFQDVFDELHIVRATDSENRIILALPARRGTGREKLVEGAKRLFINERRTLDYGLAEIIEHGYEPITTIPAGAKVLLDTDAPKE